MTGSCSSAGAPGPHGRPSRHDGDDHPVLDERRAFTAAIPDSSVGSVRKVARLDGRTRFIAGRVPGGTWWKPRHASASPAS